MNGALADSTTRIQNLVITYLSHFQFAMKGDLDDFRVYNRALIPQEVASLANPAPIPGDDSFVGSQDQPLTIAAPGVLANDSIPLGRTGVPEVVSPPASGSVTLNADGGFTYTPAAGFAGQASFTYSLREGATLFGPATVTITIYAPPIRITGMTPAPDATLTTVPATITVAFDGTVDPATLTPAFVRLIGTGTDQEFDTLDDVTVPLASIQAVGNSAVLTPAAPLTDGRYRVFLESHAAGRALNLPGTAQYVSRSLTSSLDRRSVDGGGVVPFRGGRDRQPAHRRAHGSRLGDLHARHRAISEGRGAHRPRRRHAEDDQVVHDAVGRQAPCRDHARPLEVQTLPQRRAGGRHGGRGRRPDHRRLRPERRPEAVQRARLVQGADRRSPRLERGPHSGADRRGASIVPSAIRFVSATELRFDADLTGAELGVWDVEVTNPDGSILVLPGAFTVEESLHVAAVSPAPGSTVGTPSQLTVTFNRAPENASLSAGIRVSTPGPDGQFDTGDETYVGIDTILGGVTTTVTFIEPLAEGSYRVEVLGGPTGVKDLNGASVDGEFSETFPSGNGVPDGIFAAEFSVVARPVAADQSVSVHFGVPFRCPSRRPARGVDVRDRHTAAVRNA